MYYNNTMKAVVQFEVSGALSDEELKAKLIDVMINACDEWANGKGALYIDFISINKQQNDNTSIKRNSKIHN